MIISHANLTKVKLKETNEVALSSEKDRYQTVFKALDLIKAGINDCLSQLDPKNDYILIKPSCVVASSKNCATNVEALKSVLEFMTALWSGKIIIAEGSAETTMTAFQNYGYLTLKPEFPQMEFLDLNFADAIFVDIFDQELKPLKVRIANTVAEAPFRISVSTPKTHDSTIVTLSIKNMAVGSILGEDKSSIHQGPRAINHSIAALAKYTFPHLAVIDGWQGMEGNGPVSGQMLDTHFAVASLNALAADVLTTRLMGFNPLQIGYLNLLGAQKIQKNIKIIGQDPSRFHFKFKPHRTYLDQINWT